METLTDSIVTAVQQADTLLMHAESLTADVAHASHALAPLISDLALILGMGAAVTLLFRWLKQPLVLGYIIAGFLVSPYLDFTPSVSDMESVDIWAKIGVIFLLFSLGLEFSFKKLMRIGGSASITAIVEIVLIFMTGYLLGTALGWSTMNCLFLGGMLASSSTTIIIKAFDDLGVKTKNFARVVFGVLVVEDLVVILLMVLLSTVAATQHFQGSEMLFTIGKLLFFLIIWFVMGIFLIPTILKRVRRWLNDETYLILSIGLCLGMVVLATQVGFSAELGAFIMGSILAETTSAEKIEHLLKPVKDLFGAVFFVSIGMMINPPLMLANWNIILLVTAVIIVGKFLSTTCGAVLSGQSLRQSVHVGMSMAQIGEFAFIVATLGLSLGVIDDFLFPVAVGAAVITTFTTPYMIKYADNVYFLIEKILPRKFLVSVNSYASSSQNIQAESEWKMMTRKFISSTVTNTIIVLAVIIAGVRLLLPLFVTLFSNRLYASISACAITLLVAFPFLWAMMFRHTDREKYKELWSNKQYSHGPLLILEIVRILIGVALLSYLINRMFAPMTVLLIVVPPIVVLLLIFSKRIRQFYTLIERRFMTNFNSREIAAARKESPMAGIKREFAPNTVNDTWDVHLVDLEVSQEAEYVGRMLVELPWRESYGISVVYIRRGENLIYAPGANSKILPFDHIGVIASDEQIQNFMPVFESKNIPVNNNYDVEDIVVEKILVDEHNHLNGLMIKESGIREKYDAMVVGIERGVLRIPNPHSSEIFQEHDVVWIVGNKKKLKTLHTS
ncbi:MAG: cation:proton antiporter [Prevotellaceae bacterium]|jgi:CPA2 family monovalent cation:H+ antiporter-2|nr:cation:proton antiporter [Prevotellaceae bacterium]